MASVIALQLASCPAGRRVRASCLSGPADPRNARRSLSRDRGLVLLGWGGSWFWRMDCVWGRWNRRQEPGRRR
eukprot:scaffold62829_cov28-Tisochrysis_lutea.AAC.3